MNRGSHENGRDTDNQRAASMRPRFMNRGSCGKVYQQDSLTYPASMRPRFMNRGSIAAKLDWRHNPELQ